MEHSAEAYIRRQPIQKLLLILRQYSSCEDYVLEALLEINRRGDTVPGDIRNQAWEVWIALKEKSPSYIQMFPELESL